MSLPTYLMSNFPSVRPSLNLQFDSQPTPEDMTSHLASVGATFSRASIGTYTDANGIIQEATSGQARPNYSSAGVHEGLLIEESRTNLAQSSEDFSTTDWDLLTNGTGLEPIITINQAIAPDGTASADKIFFDAGAGTTSSDSSQVNQTVTFPNNTDGTVSIWLKGESGGEQITFRGVGGSVYQLLTLTTEWQRFTITEDSGTNSDALLFGIRQDVSGHGVINSTATVYAWGAQIEEGSFSTSYIPTIPTFTSRASDGTYFDSSGVLQTASTDEERIDHKYIDGQWVEAGLLLEGASTNLLAYSEDATTSNWNSEQAITVTTNAIDAPDGNTTADLVAGIATTSLHYLAQNRSLSSSTTYTQSAFVKAEALDYCYLLVNEAGSYGNRTQAYFDLSDGTLDSSGGFGDFTLVSTDIVDVSNGWYRISMTFTTGTLTAGIARFGISDDGSTGTSGFLGDGSGVYMWGFQLEEQSQPTSYIKTTGSTATRSADVYTTATKQRSADVCYIDGTAFTDFYNQEEGTILVDAISPTVSSDTFFMYSIDDGVNERIQLRLNSSNSEVFIGDGGVTQATLSANVVSDNTDFKYIFAYKVNDFVAVLDGGTPLTDTSGTLPTPTQLKIGMSYLNDRQFSGGLKKLIYFPRRLGSVGNNAEIIKLTQ